MTKYVQAMSSHGELTFKKNGEIVSFERYDPADPESQFLADITRVDTQELADYLGWALSELKGQAFDILDIGYWYATPTGKKYEPATDHRKVSFEECDPDEAGIV
jgi:hypothetical protein